MFEGTFDNVMELGPEKAMMLSMETLEVEICCCGWFGVGREIILPSVSSVADISLSVKVNLRVVEVVRAASCRSIPITANI